jgi:hypothetical protein
MSAGTLKYRPLLRCKSGTPNVYDWMFGAVAGLEKVASLNSLSVKTSLEEQRILAEAAPPRSIREAINLLAATARRTEKDIRLLAAD